MINVDGDDAVIWSQSGGLGMKVRQLVCLEFGGDGETVGEIMHIEWECGYPGGQSARCGYCVPRCGGYCIRRYF